MKILFDAKCNDCNNTHEYFEKTTATLECKTCGGENVNRLPSAPGMVKSNFHDSTKFTNRRVKR